jgi:hypothetical protein
MIYVSHSQGLDSIIFKTLCIGYQDKHTHELAKLETYDFQYFQAFLVILQHNIQVSYMCEMLSTIKSI